MLYHSRFIIVILFYIIIALSGCAQITKYPQSTKEFIPKTNYQITYDDMWEIVLETLGEERVGTTYQSKDKKKIITGFFTQAREGANVQKSSRWSYVINFSKLGNDRIKIDIVCKIEQYLKGWGYSYEWRDITDASGYKKIAHNLEIWLYEKIEKKIKDESTLRVDNKNDSEKNSNIEVNPLYKGIIGIVLKNGNVITGQILNIENDVLQIKTKEGKILSYSFIKEVKQYIRE